MEQITVIIENGKVKIEVEGVKGARCVELTQGIEQLLGKNGNRVLKQDYYRPIEIRQKIGIVPLSPSVPEGKD